MTNSPTQQADSPRVESLHESLRRRFEVTASRFQVVGRTLELLHPRSADDLIDEDSFERDDRLPYWAEIWASSLALAERIAVERVAGEAGQGRRLLELGCGVGLTAVVAARAGFQVTATDYYTEALEFTRLNFEYNGQPAPEARLLDWRQLPEDLERFDIVAASDVLYERPNAALVAAAVARTLRPDGLGILVDPGRPPAASFAEECSRHGLRIARQEKIAVVMKAKPQAVDLYELTLERTV